MKSRLVVLTSLLCIAGVMPVLAQRPNELELLPPGGYVPQGNYIPPVVPPTFESFQPHQAPFKAPQIKFNKKIWDASFELGLNGGAGNADAFSMKTGAEFQRKTDRTTTLIDLSYARTTADSITTQNLAILDANQDWNLGDSPWSLYGKLNMVYDKLRAFDWRLVLNGGFGYRWIDNDITMLKTRLGSGVSREFGGPDESWVPEAVLGCDFERQLTKKQKLTLNFDLYPDLSDFSEYRYVAKGGWEVVLDEEPNLSLKLEASNRYDSTPQGFNPNDINYSMLLLWKI